MPLKWGYQTHLFIARSDVNSGTYLCRDYIYKKAGVSNNVTNHVTDILKNAEKSWLSNAPICGVIGRKLREFS